MNRKLEIFGLLFYMVLWLSASISAGKYWIYPAVIGAILFLAYGYATREEEKKQ